jgi:hypothetical protein
VELHRETRGTPENQVIHRMTNLLQGVMLAVVIDASTYTTITILDPSMIDMPDRVYDVIAIKEAKE